MTTIRTICAAALLVFAQSALAQETPPATPEQPAPAAPAQPAPSAPAQPPKPVINKPYDDWAVRCYDVKSPAPCDMIQSAANRQTQQRVMFISLGYAPAADSHLMQLILPLGVSFSRGVTIIAGETKMEGFRFRRCERDGCYIETKLDNNVIEALLKAQEAKIAFASDDGQDLSLPLSLKGFPQAHSELLRLNRERATNAAIGTPPGSSDTPVGGGN